MIRRPPRSTLFPYTTALPICGRRAQIIGRGQPDRLAARGAADSREGFCPWGSSASRDRKSTRLNSSHGYISYAVFCLKKKNTNSVTTRSGEQDRNEERTTLAR